MKNDFYYTDDLQFTALAVLTSKCQIKDVIFRDATSGIKYFGLFPRKDAEELYLSYVSDKIKIAPQTLSLKVNSIRHLPARIVIKN